MKSFKDYGINPSLLDQLNKIGFKTPTPIQDKAIPHILSKRDILASAGTGTGKTGAFGIPLAMHLAEDKQNQALVLLPTRELALQVIKALQDFTCGKIKSETALVIGGDSIEKQMAKLKRNPRIIVGTPGRINDHIKRGTINLSKINYFVLDEVDRMLDMGFGVQLDKIASYLTNEKQTLMFSATLPSNIKKLSRKYLQNPIEVSVESSNKSPKNIKQEEVSLKNEEKYSYLLDELNERNGSIIVFIKSKYSADSMAKKLQRDGHEAEAFHGDLRQNKRNKIISKFRSQHYRILVATDIAARGLDIPHIEHVINYDLPQCPEDYIHRIGRTARAGASGQALNFLSPNDSKKWRAIQNILSPEERSPIPKISDKKKKPSRKDKLLSKSKKKSKKQNRNFKFKKAS